MTNPTPENLIRRPDGSYVDLQTLEPRQKLAHELAQASFARAEEKSAELAEFKAHMLIEMRAFRDLLLQEYNIDVTGSEGGFSIKTVDGKCRVEMSIAKHTSFGPELMAAKALIDDFLKEELEGASEVITAIVTDAFRLNAKGRLNTDGILGLRKHKWNNPLWLQAMQAIDDAICRDSSTTYIRFYRINPEAKTETLVPLDLAKV